MQLADFKTPAQSRAHLLSERGASTASTNMLPESRTGPAPLNSDPGDQLNLSESQPLPYNTG